MLELEVLVLELLAVDRLAAGAVVVGEVATLRHIIQDETKIFSSLLGAEGLVQSTGITYDISYDMY